MLAGGEVPWTALWITAAVLWIGMWNFRRVLWKASRVMCIHSLHTSSTRCIR
jgi:hypothetical protein